MNGFAFFQSKINKGKNVLLWKALLWQTCTKISSIDSKNNQLSEALLLYFFFALKMYLAVFMWSLAGSQHSVARKQPSQAKRPTWCDLWFLKHRPPNENYRCIRFLILEKGKRRVETFFNGKKGNYDEKKLPNDAERKFWLEKTVQNASLNVQKLY